MNVLSLFSGVGGMDMGLERAGHRIVGMCEIDKHARRVLARHWPDVPLHDDVTTFDVGAFRGRVDLVAGGSPCQDLSVAGRRAGLDGQRSSLFWHQCRIADSVAAPWVLWENVVGAFSSNGGADFAAVLWGITGAHPRVPDGGWRNMGICVGPKRTAVWRLLDARWFGVAQRRRRVFVVGGPSDGRWIEVLLESESSDRDTRPSATPGSGVAALTSTGVGTCGADDNQAQAGHLVPEHVGSLQSRYHKGANAESAADGHLVTVQCATGDVTHALTNASHKGATEDGTGRGTPIVPVSFGWMNAPCQGADVVEDGVASLRKSSHPAVLDTLAVRRLTPIECERLMGWPDNWTRYADDVSEIADSHRYRMCGNGVVANVTEWIGRRLMDVTE